MTDDEILRRFEMCRGMSPAELAEHRPSSDAAFCSIHDCELIAGQSPIVYGFPGVPRVFADMRAYNAAWTTMFFYSRSWVPGGCSITRGRPNMRDVMYCPHCRAAEQAYVDAHSTET
jgi:hypothetical protein